MVIYVVKAAFTPFSAIEENPANAGVARLSELLSKQLMDRVYALPKQARYQLRYTRMNSKYLLLVKTASVVETTEAVELVM